MSARQRYRPGREFAQYPDRQPQRSNHPGGLGDGLGGGGGGFGGTSGREEQQQQQQEHHHHTAHFLGLRQPRHAPTMQKQQQQLESKRPLANNSSLYSTSNHYQPRQISHSGFDDHTQFLNQNRRSPPPPHAPKPVHPGGNTMPRWANARSFGGNDAAGLLAVDAVTSGAVAGENDHITVLATRIHSASSSASSSTATSSRISGQLPTQGPAGLLVATGTGPEAQAQAQTISVPASVNPGLGSVGPSSAANLAEMMSETTAASSLLAVQVVPGSGSGPGFQQQRQHQEHHNHHHQVKTTPAWAATSTLPAAAVSGPGPKHPLTLRFDHGDASLSPVASPSAASHFPPYPSPITPGHTHVPVPLAALPLPSPTTASPLNNLAHPSAVLVENFSRPRKHSIRTATPEPSPHSGPNFAWPSTGSASTPTQTPAPISSTSAAQFANPSPANPSLISPAAEGLTSFPPAAPTMWPRPRATSNSSAVSTASATEYYDSRTGRSRPPMGGSGSGVLAPSGYSTRSPMPQPWMAKEASRSSFRSQASSAQVTSRTEESSIRTRGTPVSSLYNEETQDDSIVDDVMGMYYQGFADSDVEPTTNDDDDVDNRAEDIIHDGQGLSYASARGASSTRKVSNTIHDHNNYNSYRVYDLTHDLSHSNIRNDHDRDQKYYDASSQRQTPLQRSRTSGAEPTSHQRPRYTNSGPEVPLPQPATPQYRKNQSSQSSGTRNVTPVESSSHQLASLSSKRQPAASASSNTNRAPPNAAFHNNLTPEHASGPRRPRPRSSSVPPNMTMMSPGLTKNPELRDSGKSLGLANNSNNNPSAGKRAEASDLNTPIRSPTLLSKTPTINTPISRAPTPPPPDLQPAPAQIKPEDPLARDRYGFRKENQYITRETYDKWNEGYTQYLARRRKKWNVYMKENGLMTENPTRFPTRNAKTKRFVRKGIPPEWRGAAWFYYAGGPAMMAKNSGVYDRLLRQKAKDIDAEAIERDLHRTFPDNIKFRPNGVSALSNTTEIQKHMVGDKAANSNVETPIISALRRLLLAFAVYNPQIGYCQSLNFLAGLLLLFIDSEEHCFWLLNVITNCYLPGTHETSLEGSKVDLAVMMSCLCETIPDLFHKLVAEPDDDTMRLGTAAMAERARAARKVRPKKRDPISVLGDRLPPITLFMTSWFMNCFIGVLPIETTLRVWDVFFCEGSKSFFRVAMTIFRAGETQIRTADPMEIFPVVQGLPRRLIDANAILELCFRRRGGFNNITQQLVDERRAEARRLGEVERRKQVEVEAEPAPSKSRLAMPFGGPRRRQGTHA
ncbi:hypothetical protein BROUX41_002013 [Berkeleyomyces rouxiae]